MVGDLLINNEYKQPLGSRYLTQMVDKSSCRNPSVAFDRATLRGLMLFGQR